MLIKIRFLSVALLLCAFVGPSRLLAQGGLRESLERLDRNGNNEIDPSEITPLARPYLERISTGRRLSLGKSNPISDFLVSARIYFALQNGVANTSVRPEKKSTVRTFAPDDDQTLVPEFGLAEIKYEYTPDDLDEADDTLRRSDDNDDGFIDRSEARRARWTHNDPFEMDLNKDNLLSRMELAQRYARRRLLDSASQELIQKARRVGNEVDARSASQGRESDYRRRASPASYYLAVTMIGHFDRDRDGKLESREYANMGIPIGRVDTNGDEEISRDELTEYLSQVQSEIEGEGGELPSWFQELDADSDGQVAMAEYTDEWSEEKSFEFAGYDLNSDGLLTRFEVARSKSLVGGQFNNETAVPLPPGKTVVSEIVISDDVIIGDLDVQLNITHSHVSGLDAYLTGPNGERMELFTEVGGSGDHFDRTVFDDQSRFPIIKGQAPFRDSFLPEAALKQQPSLSQFTGQSAQGVWQLSIVGTRSERYGMLHNWSLNIRPTERAAAEFARTSTVDDPQLADEAPVQQRMAKTRVPEQEFLLAPPADREQARADFAEVLKKKDLKPDDAAKYMKKFEEKMEKTNTNKPDKRK